MNPEVRVAIVGGGLAGLSAANRLARKSDSRITLYEKAHTLGGRASTVVKSGFHLNQGAHALYNAGAANAYIKELRVVLPGAPPPNSNALAFWQGKFATLPLDLASLAMTSLFNAGEKLVLGKFLAELPHIKLDTLNEISFRDWLATKFQSETVIAYLLTLNRLGTYSNGPDVIAAGPALRQLQLGQQGVTYLDGGWQSIVEGLRRALPKPIDERVNAEVTVVGSAEGGGVSITADGATEVFDFVILALPPGRVAQIAPGALPDGLLEKLVECRMACLDICLRELPDQKKTYALGLDEPLYYSVHSATAKLADDGGAQIPLGFYLGPGETGGEMHLERMLNLLDKLQPGWQDLLVYKRYLPNMVASYSTASVALRGINGLPTPALQGSDRMFACGDWVGSGHLLSDASVASALSAADMVAQRLHVAAC